MKSCQGGDYVLLDPSSTKVEKGFKVRHQLRVQEGETIIIESGNGGISMLSSGFMSIMHNDSIQSRRVFDTCEKTTLFIKDFIGLEPAVLISKSHLADESKLCLLGIHPGQRMSSCAPSPALSQLSTWSKFLIGNGERWMCTIVPFHGDENSRLWASAQV